MSGKARRGVLRLKGERGNDASPTPERVRHATHDGGLACVAAGAGGATVHILRYPLQIDRLLATGLISPDEHAIALRARELFERTSFRERLTAAYRDRTGRTANDPEQEDADDRYRGFEARILREAGRIAWTAYRDVVVDDRPPRSRAALASLASALHVAGRMR